MNFLDVDTIEEVKGKLEKYFGGPVGTGGIDNVDAGGAGNDEAGAAVDLAARALVDLAARTAPVEEVPLFLAAGRFLAEEILAEEDVPAFSRSVVDGYAVVAADSFGVGDAAPVFLEIMGAVEMGRGFPGRVTPGQAVYVPTGGVLPEGADAVIMVEFTERLDEKTLAIYKPAAPGNGVMGRGEDFRRGQLLYKKGQRLAARDIGLLAAVGKALVQVYKPPQVAIISTGDELVSVVDQPGPGQVRDVNAYALAALVEESGGKVSGVALARDAEADLRKAIETARRHSSIILISGGSSAGDKDITAKVIDSLGAPGVFTHGMAMKPGKPTIVGGVQGCCCGGRPDLVVGLPGHPMAAVIAYKVVVDYFIKRYCFGTEQRQLTVPARLTENLRAGEGRTTFVLVRLRQAADKAAVAAGAGDMAVAAHMAAGAAGAGVAANGGQPPVSYEGGQWLAEPIHAKSGSISQLRDAQGYLQIPHQSEGYPKGALVPITIL